MPSVELQRKKRLNFRLSNVLARLQKLAAGFLLLAFSLTPQPAAAVSPGVHLTARSAFLMDFRTERVFLSKNPHVRRAPASTAKILTALVVMDRLSTGKVLTASSKASAKPRTKIYVRSGERFYVRDLLKALLIASANDTAVVLAEGVAGSESAFAKLMNQKAREVGAKNSHFLNASGLPVKGQVSTAYDLAQIMQAAARDRFLMDTMKTRTASIKSLSGRTVRLRNHNKMMWRDRRKIYGKTGWTRASRHCFAGRILHNNRDLCVVTMGSVKPWDDLRKLLDYSSGRLVARKLTPAGAGQNLSMDFVKSMQKVLKEQGYDPGPIDGMMGPRTMGAVMSFQRDQGLKPDGVVGPLTKAKLQPFIEKYQ